ncbi:shTK domain protein [Ancylostoma caninum]|uniref:ShTK domain protein n=1 Tax=Ancylostoma caninum TaxID=29170 RepID=A0A368GVD4_ANCCA|nr:shTK domain protein [Ancylostoma caninum]
MLHLVWVLTLLLPDLTDARVTDLNCTERIGNEPRYSERAVKCENRYSESSCLFMYGNPVRQGDNADRNVRCFQNPTTRQVDSDLVRMATNTCPKTCGYCCKTPEFSCENKQDPRINCSLVTNEQCRSELWRPILLEDCPNVCGLCTASGCNDLAPDCQADRNICSRPDMKAFVEVNCKRTCDLCAASTTTNTTLPPGLLEGLLNGTTGGVIGGGAIGGGGIGTIIGGLLTTTPRPSRR